MVGFSVYFACLTIIVTLVVCGWALFERFVRRSHLKSLRAGEVISLDDFAIVERDLIGLSEVIVLSNIMETPNRLLEDSIRDNLAEGVKYSFYVSSENLQHARDLPLKFFHKVQDVQDLSSSDHGPRGEHLTQVHDRGSNHEDFPYIFLVSKRNNAPRTVICFRGLQKAVGVAANYVMVSPEVAYTMYKFLAGTISNTAEQAEKPNFPSKLSKSMIELRGNQPLISPGSATTEKQRLN